MLSLVSHQGDSQITNVLPNMNDHNNSRIVVIILRQEVLTGIPCATMEWSLNKVSEIN